MTIPDYDYLKNTMAFEPQLTKQVTDTIIADTYKNVCDFIRANNYVKPTDTMIESFITGGSFEFTDKHGWTNTFTCDIEALADRQELFKNAIAKQFIFDLNNGRKAMTDGVDLVCHDTISRLKTLGLIVRSFEEKLSYV